MNRECVDLCAGDLPVVVWQLIQRLAFSTFNTVAVNMQRTGELCKSTSACNFVLLTLLDDGTV